MSIPPTGTDDDYEVPTQPELPEDPAEDSVDGWTVAEVAGDRINVFDAPIIAGDPAGARIEIRSTGFHAFNGAGRETAHINGTEGVFVGGEFRTSDTLPGQVTLADNAYVDTLGGVQNPGIRVDPINPTAYIYPPGIGPNSNGMVVSGGRSADGSRAYTIYSPAGVNHEWKKGSQGAVMKTSAGGVSIWADAGDGRQGVVQTTPDIGKVYTLDSGGTVSKVEANASEAFLYTRAGGSSRYLTVDATGVWVKTAASGSMKWYNLEETAQDSGWNSITLASGITGNGDPAWRNKGGVIYFRGNFESEWIGGTWETVATGLPTEMRPAIRAQMVSPGIHQNRLLFRVGTDGTLNVRADDPGAVLAELSGIIYTTG